MDEGEWKKDDRRRRLKDKGSRKNKWK